MYRSLSKFGFIRKSSRIFVQPKRFNTDLANDQLSPVIAKTFFDLDNKDVNKVVVKDSKREFSLGQILKESRNISQEISALTGNNPGLNCAFLADGSLSLITQYAIWMSGNAAIPLTTAHPRKQIEYYINDSAASVIMTTPEFESKMKPIAEKLNKPLLLINNEVQPSHETNETEEIKNFLLNKIPCRSNDPAMIVYTSGTTSKPKGVVLTHANLGAQITSLSSAWNMSSADTLLHTLPLHHVHGLINALLLPISVGAKAVMLPKFDSDEVWSYLLNINKKDRINMFMAVPTIYSYLIQEYDKLFNNNSQMKEYIRTHCSSKIRLMISGSAPLNSTTFKRWKEITGHNLLERYGMTEIGMALSNPLHEDETRKRLPGFTGTPLPLVEARIVNFENSKEVLMEAKGELHEGVWSNTQVENKIETQEIIGNLQIKGPTVFKEYFGKPEATKESFTEDGFFITGDSVAYLSDVKSFKILGRNSVDIIKSRGYKISALEIETKLLENPNIQDCAVIGIPDEVLGQSILALIVTKNEIPTEEITKFCEEKFAKYSLPSIKIIESVPRNIMGKVNKAELVKLYS